MERKGIIKNSVFLLSSGNILIYLFVYGFGCLNSGWTCSGDNMGGIMMVYSLTIFIPQLVAFIYFTIHFLSKMVSALQRNQSEQLNRSDWVKIIIYFILVAVASSI
ncbi:hypothetical protein [uncultured Endozoicomonas sp.]|uniref:hypothetical protein n=1 Tax=uncultured Endozoicomonas sp. TaxID=432652 RepID=UPI0026087B7A|nr:hypothetical protein [uncultured Endozoicomonas sp.]